MFFPRHRPARTLTQLFELRKERDAQLAERRRFFGQRALARVKARYDADPGKPVVWNLLVISGGGDWTLRRRLHQRLVTVQGPQQTGV